MTTSVQIMCKCGLAPVIPGTRLCIHCVVDGRRSPDQRALADVQQQLDAIVGPSPSLGDALAKVRQLRADHDEYLRCIRAFDRVAPRDLSDTGHSDDLIAVLSRIRLSLLLIQP